MSDFTHCYAVPGANSIIDGINPETGLTFVYGKSEADIKAEAPDAVKMTWDEWQAAAIARQQTELRWVEATERQYNDMLNVLPPAFWSGSLFLVGEPTDHCHQTGRPRFQAYRRGYLPQASSRPITIAEAKAMR